MRDYGVFRSYHAGMDSRKNRGFLNRNYHRIVPHPSGHVKPGGYASSRRIQFYNDGKAEESLAACSGSDSGVERGFIRMIRDLRLDEGKQTLVLLGSSKKFKCDAANTHRTDHSGQFKRYLSFY